MAKVNIVLDASMLDGLMQCELRFDRRYNKNIHPVTNAEPLDRGTIIHAGQEAYWETLKLGQPWEAAVDNGLVAARFAVSVSDLDPIDGTNYINSLEGSFTFWKVQDLSFEVLSVESPFTYTLWEDDHFRVHMIGKVDLVLRNNVYDKLPFDHKSFERDYGVKRFTNQFINYAEAVGANVLIVNRIGVYSENTKKKPEERYKRVPLSFDPLFFDQWKANTIKWALRYYQDTLDNDWPANLTSCDKYNRECEYYNVCNSSGMEAQEYKLMTDFKIGPKWDVSKSLVKASELVQEAKDGKSS